MQRDRTKKQNGRMSCDICFEEFVDDKLASICEDETCAHEHVFCSACREQLSSCPYCRRAAWHPTIVTHVHSSRAELHPAKRAAHLGIAAVLGHVGCARSLLDMHENGTIKGDTEVIDICRDMVGVAEGSAPAAFRMAWRWQEGTILDYGRQPDAASMFLSLGIQHVFDKIHP